MTPIKISDIRIGQGFAISAAFEAGVSTHWSHGGYRYELEGVNPDTQTGNLSIVPDRLDQMPVEFEVDSVVCSGGKLRINLVPSMTLELYLAPEREAAEAFE